jgi:long-chain acyl-CoA synthetase
LAELKPTVFASVPRLYNKFYDTIQENIAKLTGFKSDLAKKAIAAKLDNLHSSA